MNDSNTAAMNIDALLDDTRDSIIFALMISSLGIGLAMVSLSRDPVIALNVGGTMFAIAAAIFISKVGIATLWIRNTASYKDDYAALLTLRANLVRACYRQAGITAGSIAIIGWVMAILAGLLG